ncbi:Por secretion system C-terminal sorting domain-containing protein [Soonwooa buanensis]|uniref:Por secretion system C-terminal sorting domain-containing protein n=1 Tax=Soonwooa buanensis TaxID=619805 RepID=A0A1T5FKS5_9FLAO|nr:T9SS type A sorting domain-containing protein [Soonwooa buanensis]SKB96824.1 Por secretion system C-terminal sorting domain-containing protein [Soonwooa buanensis]
MKKSTILASLLLMSVFGKGQEKIRFNQSDDFYSIQKSYNASGEKITINNNFAELISSKPSTLNNSNKNETPLFSSRAWGQISNIDDNSLRTFELNYTFGSNANATIKLLNDDLETTKTINFNLPSTANDVQVLSQASKDIGPNDGKLKFIVFVHYFEGGTGPNYQKNVNYIFNEDGEKIGEIPGIGAFVRRKANQEIRLITRNLDYPTTGTFYKLYDQSFNLKKEYFVDKSFTNGYAGSPLSFINVNGQEKLVLSQYEKLFMTPSQEVTPDNHLVVKIADLDFNFEKEVKLNIQSKYPDKPKTFARANFATFPLTSQFSISNHTFNNDDQLEFLYAITYQDVLQDKMWSNYYVADEAGNILKSYEDNVIGEFALASIEGEKEQVGFVVGDGNVIQRYDMFDVADWSTKVSFSSIINNQMLKPTFNRFKNPENTTSYIFATNNGVREEGSNISYGLVNEYSVTGEFQKENRIYIGIDPQGFSVNLSDGLLSPYVYNEDAKREFTYAYFAKVPNSTKYYNTMSIGTGDGEVLFSKDGLGTLGDVNGTGFLRDHTNSRINKLGVYYKIPGATIISTEFYDVPFTNNLSTSNILKKDISIYIDRLNKTLNWTENAEIYEVYSMSGALLKSGKNTNKISTADMLNGVYIIKLKTKNFLSTKKFIVN